MRPSAHFKGIDWLLLQGAAALALLIGLYARFKGLGDASMAADEYYIARSVENILRVGLPQYLCGGYYPRAIAFQYGVALLSESGLGVDAAARWVAAVAGVIGLPAAWLLGRRVGGRAAGLGVLIVLALSLWEVEISRFGRMYAPFQTVFLWYAWVYLRVTVDGERRLLWPLFGLAILGVLTWEGGAFLALTGLLVPFVMNPSGRLGWRDGAFLAANFLLLVGAFALLLANLRLAGGEPPFPDNYDVDAAREVTAQQIGKIEPMWHTVKNHTAWLIAAAVPAALAVLALVLPWRLRARWPGALALVLALAAAVFHQFSLAVCVLLIALLMRLVSRQELWRTRGARLYWLAFIVFAAFWFVYGLTSRDWVGAQHIGPLRGHRLLQVVYELARFPDFLTLVAFPWLRAVPLLTVLLALGVGVALVQHLRSPASGPTHAPSPMGVLLLLAVCLLAAVGLSEPPRIETRYIFFLYPLLIVIAFGAVARLGGRSVSVAREASPLLIGVAVVLFMLTEDFRPKHLVTIDSPRALLRLDMPEKLAGHIVGRTDIRGAVQWMGERDAPGTLLVNAYPSADYYFHRFAFTYIDEDSSRFRAYSCRRGTTERWGNLPLVYRTDELTQRVQEAGGGYVLIADTGVADLERALARLNPRVSWKSEDGQLVVLAVGTPSR